MSTSADADGHVKRTSECQPSEKARRKPGSGARTLSKLTFTHVLLSCEHFGSSVACRPAEGLHETSLLKLAAETEVRDFDVAAFVEEDIFQFEITMNDTLTVYVRDTKAELTEDAPRLGLSQTSLFDEVVEELPSGA